METSKHPLFDTEITGVYNWKQWKEAWKNTNQFELLHSLLHFGFEVEALSDTDWQDRLLTYMAIADGYNDETMFRRPDQRRYEQLDPQQKQKHALARKAFEVLCLKVFRLRSREEHTGGVETFLNAPNRIESLLDFFRAQNERGYWSLRNSGSDDDRHWQNAKEFLLSLICQAWNYDAGWNTQNDEARQFPFRRYRPRFVEILAGLGELDLLLPVRFRTRKDLALNPDDACLSKLEEIAMRVEYLFPGDDQKTRCPKTLEEALYQESRAARTLIILRILRDEQERFNEIEEAQREQHVLERKLRELKS